MKKSQVVLFLNRTKLSDSTILQGVGVNLRLEYIDDFLRIRPDVTLLQVIADNWLSEGPHHKKLEKLREDYEVSFHCVGMNIGGTGPLRLNYLEAIRELSLRFQPTEISDHLCFQAYGDVFHHDLLPIPYNEESFENCRERVITIQDIFQRTILVENLSYYCEYKSSTMSEAEFIKQLSEKTDCGLLLDLQNIMTNSENLNINALEFLNRINLEKVKEMHVAGGERVDNLLLDSHSSAPSAEVLELARKVVKKKSDIKLVYERDNNLPSFNQFIEEVRHMRGFVYDI